MIVHNVCKSKEIWRGSLGDGDKTRHSARHTEEGGKPRAKKRALTFSQNLSPASTTNNSTAFLLFKIIFEYNPDYLK